MSYTACLDFLPPFRNILPRTLQNSSGESVFETVQEAIEVGFTMADCFEQRTEYPLQLLIKDDLENIVMNHSQIMAAYHRTISGFSYSHLIPRKTANQAAPLYPKSFKASQ